MLKRIKLIDIAKDVDVSVGHLSDIFAGNKGVGKKEVRQDTRQRCVPSNTDRVIGKLEGRRHTYCTCRRAVWKSRAFGCEEREGGQDDDKKPRFGRVRPVARRIWLEITILLYF